jgi:hypothetical protein
MHHPCTRRFTGKHNAVRLPLISLGFITPELALAQASPFMTGATALQTKGRTLLAAAARLQDAFPAAEIRAFAMLRTMGFVQGVDHLLDPCVGEIRWSEGDAYRTP